MTTPQRTAKKNAAKSLKKATTRVRKKKFLTRAEARRRAERHVLNRMFKGVTVRDGAKARLNTYAPGREWTNADVWVVYKNSEVIAFKASDVVLVCKRTGRVLYEGSACDEG